MSVLSKAYFHDEAAAFAHVEALLWANGRACPHCGTVDNSYPLKNQRTKPTKKSPEGVERHGLYKCGDCRKQFTVRIGTIFEESHLPLHKWLQAIHLVCSSKKGISAHQLHRTLEVQYKTAWFLAHRIREAMRNGDFSPMGSGGKIVEVERRTTEGFLRGRTVIEGLGEDRGGKVEINFQNEWVVVWRDGKPVVSTPELICVLDSESGEAIGTETIRYGQRTTVIALPASAVFLSPRGLDHVGPRAFGYEIDFKSVFQS